MYTDINTSECLFLKNLRWDIAIGYKKCQRTSHLCLLSPGREITGDLNCLHTNIVLQLGKFIDRSKQPSISRNKTSMPFILYPGTAAQRLLRTNSLPALGLMVSFSLSFCNMSGEVPICGQDVAHSLLFRGICGGRCQNVKMGL